MTRILKDNHRSCGECGWWAFALRFVVRRRWQCLGVCTCKASEHHGHGVTIDHQACGHRKEIKEKMEKPQRPRKKE